MGQAEGLQTRDGCAVAFDYARRDRAGAGDADLLADDRPYARLERIPGPGCANPRPAAEKRADHGVGLEVAGRPVHVGVEVENSSGPLDHVDQALPVRQVGAEHDVI